MGVVNRLQKLRQRLAEKGLDGILISQPENRFYLSGFHGSAGYLLITGEESVLAVDFRYTEQAKTQAPDYRVQQISATSLDWFVQLSADLKVRRLGFESGHVTFAFHQQLSGALGKAQSRAELVPVDGLVEGLRAVKEPKEIELIAKAEEIADSAIEHARSVIRTGMTEGDIAWEIERFMRESGSQSVPFEVIVASGPNAALPHARPSERRIGPGETVVIDIGAMVGNYASDLTRTLCLETTAGRDTRFNRVYDTVLRAQQAALETITEGMSGAEADAIARRVISEAGFGEAFGHSLGHGVGLAVHEQPRLGPGSADVLVSGMVFSIEPGIYLPGWGGVRIEDLVVMENGRLRMLSRSQK